MVKFAISLALLVLTTIVCLTNSVTLHAQKQVLTRPVDYSISTIIGDIGDGKPAVQVSIALPTSLAVDKRNGNIYYTDAQNYQIRYFDMDGISHYFAGSPYYQQADAPYDGLAFANDSIGAMSDIALNSKGEVFISVQYQFRVKKVFYNESSNAFNMVTLAGGGSFIGSGIPALSANIQPKCVTVSPLDEVFFCDSLSFSIKKIVNGTIYTVVGTGVSGNSPDGTFAHSAMISQPNKIVFHPLTGEMYFSDLKENKIRYIASDGCVYTYALFNDIHSIVFHSNGDMYVSSISKHQILRIVNGTITVIANELARIGFSEEYGPALSAQFNNPLGLAIHGNNLFIADAVNYRVRKIDLTTNIINTVAGDGRKRYSGYPNVASQVGVEDPKSTFYNSQTDELFLLDSNTVLRLNSLTNDTNSTMVEIIAGTGNSKIDIDGKLANETSFFNPSTIFQSETTGDVYIGTSNSIVKISKETNRVETIAGSVSKPGTGNGQPAQIAILYLPSVIALNENGEILICESKTIRKIHLNGTITQLVSFFLFVSNGISFIGNSDFVFSHSFQNTIVKYIASSQTFQTIAGTGLFAFNGDGAALATNIDNPAGLCVNASSGEIYFADVGNKRIRKIGLDGNIKTIVGNGTTTFSPDGQVANETSVSPFAVAIHPISKELYFSDSSVAYSVFIRKIDSVDGKVYTIIGGQDYSTSFTFSPNGDMYIGTKSHFVKKMDFGTNIAYRVAGSGTGITTGDGPALSTQLILPRGLVSNSNGELYMVSGSNNYASDSKIKKLANGMITTIAGGIGDGGLAIEAYFGSVSSIQVTDTDIYLSDYGNYRIRKISLSTNVITSVVGAFSLFNGDQLANETNINVFDIKLRNGEIYFTDLQINKIRKTDITGKGQVITLGGISENELKNPSSIGFLPSGEIIFADTDNHVIRKMDLNGNLSIIAGQLTQRGFNLDSNAKNSLLSYPSGISITKDGRIVFIEKYRVRMLTPSCPQGYNMTMNANGLVCSTVVDSPKVTCFGIPFDVSNVCSGKGVCQSLNNCTCTVGFGGNMCEMVTCYGKTSNDSSVCSGNGNCSSVDKCECQYGWKGLNCSLQDVPKKEGSSTDYCTLYPTSYVCSPSSSINTTETQVSKVSNITELDSKTIEFTSISTISISLPSTISQYLQNNDNSLKNDSIQVISSIAEIKSSISEINSVISPIISLVLLKSSSNEKITVRNLTQPISLSFENITFTTLDSLESLNVSCVYFDENLKEWKSDGMDTEIHSLTSSHLSDGNITLTLSIRCNTNHLTSFSVIDQNYKKAATKPTLPSKSNTPTPPTKEDQSLQDTSVIIGAVVGVIGGVCVIVIVITIIITFVCLLKKRKKQEEEEIN